MRKFKLNIINKYYKKIYRNIIIEKYNNLINTKNIIS